MQAKSTDLPSSNRYFAEVVFLKNDGLIFNVVPAPDMMELPQATTICRAIRPPCCALGCVEQSGQRLFRRHGE